ncbi:MAG: hypothetical protein M0D55_17475 [Elusimicrobiota bacterium]|nr:MAG: hypothetical protein M0D55_17475 [Elusimicrobiota bacterium]
MFSAEGKILECSRRGKRGALFSDEDIPTTTRDEFDARVRALYASIEELGRLYAKGMPVLDADRARVKSFADEFAFLSSKGHAAAYRALSPEFWAWVEQNGGGFAPSSK